MPGATPHARRCRDRECLALLAMCPPLRAVVAVLAVEIDRRLSHAMHHTAGPRVRARGQIEQPAVRTHHAPALRRDLDLPLLIRFRGNAKRHDERAIPTDHDRWNELL